MSANQKQKAGLVPKLRFPEFQGVGEWQWKFLEDVAPLQRGFDLPSDQIQSGTVPVVYSNGIQKFHKAGMAKGPGLVTGRSGTIGKLHFIEDGEYWPHNTALWVTSFRDNLPKFVYYLYTSIGMSQFASGSGVPTLNRNDVHAFKALVPLFTSEQQKIADCLTSLDDLIRLEAEKLDAIKTHKKGLMQQLFPAEGETLPKLRFPEFRDAGEWEETILGKVGSVRMCKRIFKEQTNSIGEIPFYKIGTFGGTPDAYIPREIFDDYRSNYPFPRIGATLISAAGTIGRAIRYKGESAYFQDSNIVWLDNDGRLITDNFLFYLYQLIDWTPSVGAIQRLYNDNILGTKVKYPTISEQQKIADCLSALDSQITTQAEKIEALKAHKKGLMQQLFPSLGGVAGEA